MSTGMIPVATRTVLVARTTSVIWESDDIGPPVSQIVE